MMTCCVAKGRSPGDSDALVAGVYRAIPEACRAASGSHCGSWARPEQIARGAAHVPRAAIRSAPLPATMKAMSESAESKTIEHMEAFKEWIASLREDIDTLKGIVVTSKIDSGARIYAAAALNYLVSRMDLVPDWEETVGLIDDVMVVRLCVELASQHRLDQDLEDAAHIVAVGRLLNEVPRIDAFLGASLSADLRGYCRKLTETPVRGRSCSKILESEAERSKLFEEVDQDLQRMPAASFEDPSALAVKFKSYLAHKLKN